MKRMIALMVGTSLMCAAPLSAQDKKADKPKEMPKATQPAAGGEAKGAPSMEEMMKQYEAAAKPGPMHAWLAKGAGHWKATVKMADPATGKMGEASAGEMKSEMVFEGRYLAFDFKSTMMGQPYQGHGTTAYNNVEKRFETVWFDTMTTGIMMMTGQVDKDGKVLTVSGECREPGGQTKKMKQVSTWTGENSMKDEFFDVVDGKDVKSMEIEYTRADAGAKGEKHEAKHEEKKAK